MKQDIQSPQQSTAFAVSVVTFPVATSSLLFTLAVCVRQWGRHYEAIGEDLTGCLDIDQLLRK